MRMISTFALLSSLLLADGLASANAQHQVFVGGPTGAISFFPSNISANPNDTVLFTFRPFTHSVTQSTFLTPCVEANVSEPFDSGLISVSNGSTGPTVEFLVKDATPKWFYCRPHCKFGMVFSINANESSSQNYAAFKSRAVNPPKSSSLSSSKTSAKSSATSQLSTASKSTSVSAKLSSTTKSATTMRSTSKATVTTKMTSSNTSKSATTMRSTSKATVTTKMTSSSTRSSAPSASASNHIISVGDINGTLLYTPSNITAKTGDTVTFQFHPKSHSVTQSSFSAPCRPLNETTGQPSFDSGIRPATANTTSIFAIKVNSTAPIWVYCKQISHCGKGMVFSINANASSSQSYAAFKALAIKLNGTSA